MDPFVADSIRGLVVIGLADAALLYAMLIRRRARRRREFDLHQQVGLRGLVRVFLTEDGSRS